MNKFLTLTEARKLIPGEPSSASLNRWCRRGFKTSAGIVVKLRHERAGLRYFTTTEWLAEFFAAVDAKHKEAV